MTKPITAEEIDAVLPQTQCGLCGYAGCMPYATALAQGKATIDLCPPGGENGLRAIAHLLNQDPGPYLSSMKTKAKPPLRAQIRETDCIGCTKCIQACPVDAIVGAAKSMHTVIRDECTGCELCLPPCPVDCIEMIKTADATNRSQQYRQRYYARQQRIEQTAAQKSSEQTPTFLQNKKAYLATALLRAKQKL